MSPETPAPRIQLDLPIEYRRHYGRDKTNGVLKNISLTGAFLETGTQNYIQNERLRLTFTVAGRLRKIQASIVWVSDAGVGVKFLPFNNRDIQIVDDLIYFVSTKQSSQREILDEILGRVDSSKTEDDAA